MRTSSYKLTTLLGFLCMIQASGEAAYEEMDGEDYPYMFCCPDLGDFAVTVDWLYWRPCPSSVYAALEGVKTEPVDQSDPLVQTVAIKIINFDHSLDSGVRVGVNYAHPECMNWQIGLSWFYYGSCESRSFPARTSDPDSFLITVFCSATPADPFGNFFESDSVKWDLDIHVADLESSCPFCLCNCLVVEPHLGFRFSSVDQHLRTKTVTITEVNPGIIEDVTTERFQNEFCGVGPRLGVNLSWEYGCGFGIFGTAAASFLYGKRESSKKEVDVSTSTGLQQPQPDAIFRSDDTDNTRCSRVINDLTVGFYWEACICQSTDVNIHLGWEHHAFYNQNVFDGIVSCLIASKEEDGSLTTQGLTLGVTVGF